MSEYTGGPKHRKQDISSPITSFLVGFSSNFLLEISLNYSQISRSLINFQDNNSHFQGVSRALEMTFQIQALFKEFKDLYEHRKRLKDTKIKVLMKFEICTILFHSFKLSA